MPRTKKAQILEVDPSGTARVRDGEPVPPAGGKYPVSTTRAGKKAAVVYLSPLIKRKLKELSLVRDRSIQDLMEEAVLEFLQKNGKP